MPAGPAHGVPVADAPGPQGQAQETDRQTPPITEHDAGLGVVGRFREVLAAAPDAVAVSDEHVRVTFRGLADLAAFVLAGVRAAMSRSDSPLVTTADGAAAGPDPVAVLCGNEAAAVGAMLGVIASSYPLLPLDVRMPQERLRRLVTRAGARVVVCGPELEEAAAALAEQVIVVTGDDVHDGVEDADRVPAEHLWAQPPPVGTVAVLHPVPDPDLSDRGALAALDHRTLLLEAYRRAMAADGLHPRDTVAHTLPVASAEGLTSTLAAVLSGAHVQLYDMTSRGIDPLADWIQAERPSVLCLDALLVRSLLRTWPWDEQFASLRSVLVCGRVVYAKEFESFRVLLPPASTVHHWYSTAEGGLLGDHAVRADGPAVTGALAAGTGVHDREIVVVDEQDRPVPTGRTGQVTAICRTHLFTGYWLDPVAGRRTVTVNPDGSRTYRTGDMGWLDADGVLHLGGRHDHCVRIAGQLVDPAEVDAVLFGLPEVREAVVVGAPCDDGPDQRLVAYVVPDADQPSGAKLRAALRAVLPTHLVPEAVVYLDAALPRSEDGAVDRARLPAPPPRPVAAAGEVPQTRWEEMVAEIWADVLELDRVGRSEDFFDLGGDSLSAEALISRVICDLGAGDDVCTTSLLIQAPTVAEFAARLRDAPAVRRGPLVPLHRAGRRPPLFIMAGGGGLGIAFVPWARLLGPDQPTWALQCPALEGRGLPELSIRSMAGSHLAAIRRVQPRGPYYLAGHSFGGLLALEMAHQLRAAGQRVGLLTVIDTFPPSLSSQPPLPQRDLVQKVRDLGGVTLMSVLSTPGGRDHWRFQNHAARLMHRYSCAPWDGRTLVLVADTAQKDLRSNWAPHLTGTWRLASIPGDHLSITRFPWAAAVADELRAELAAAQGLT